MVCRPQDPAKVGFVVFGGMIRFKELAHGIQIPQKLQGSAWRAH